MDFCLPAYISNCYLIKLPTIGQLVISTKNLFFRILESLVVFYIHYFYTPFFIDGCSANFI